MRIFEKHRPRTLAEVVGQDRACAALSAAMRLGLGGNALWVSGPSGAGKSTLAMIAARSMAHECCIVETTGRELSPSRVRSLADETRQYGLSPGGRVVVVNEAHGCSGPTIEVLLDVLESIPNHALWAFTTTKIGQESLFADHADAGPLLSRCIPIVLTNQGIAEAFAANVQRIARAEGLDGEDIASYVRLARAHKSNHRAMLEAVAGGAMLGGGAA